MAVRSGAGTGVVVSLVVFVITTVALLILAIVFYRGQTIAQEDAADAEAALAKYVKPAQRSTDTFKQFEAQAGSQSVAGWMNERHQNLMSFVAGNPSADQTSLETRIERLGAAKGQTLTGLIDEQERRLRNIESELESKNELLAQKDNEVSELEARIESLNDEHEQRLADLRNELSGYMTAAKEYKNDVQDVKDAIESSNDRLRDSYDSQIDDLENRNDDLNQDVVVLRRRIDELQNLLKENRARAMDPSLLVDARVINISGDDEVWINRGQQDRLVLGMTFEIYDSPENIRVNQRTGELPRGKASAQITQVGEQTARAKITRSSPGRPVVRDDVLANAVYDPDYRFSFLVHGKFDENKDGRPTESEADYLRSLILEWGGTVVNGENLPGDLDFLVLGEQPPMPVEPSFDAPEHVSRDFIRKRQAVETYQGLFKQAQEAQIPVINANRLFILLGYPDR